MHDVVAAQRGDRHVAHIAQAQLGGERIVGGADLVEARFAVVGQVHLVDGHDHMLQFQQLDDGRMPLGLGQQLGLAVDGRHARDVDQDDGSVRGRSARHHVARVLLVARRISDDELAARGREIAVRHVDRDALLALGLQAVGQQ